MAAGARIGPDTTLIDVEVGEKAVVTRTQASLSVIGPGANVGPYAYLRPGTTLGAGGKIGTFVETKNARIGAGAKAPHLSYLGDAVIGDGANIGAGVIFANYDGVQKSTSTVGAYSFVGSNSVLAAPVEVADGAYIAAGSTITGDVGPGELAVSRSRQRNVPGWVARKRAGTKTARAAEAALRAEGAVVSSLKRPERQATLMLFTGRAHPELANEVAELLKVEIVPTRAISYANSEIYVRFEESVRGCDAFVIQSHAAPVNEWTMEQLIMVDALKRASAKRITVVAPFYPYARQDKKHRGREPISARLIADLFRTAGANRMMSVDLHAAQIQGFFDGPVDHLWALPVLSDYLVTKYDTSEMTVVSPDAGRVRVADMWTDRLNCCTGDHPQATRPERRQHGRHSRGRRRGGRAGSACWSTT